MATYQSVQAAIKAAIVATSRRPASAVVWADEARPFAADPWILLSMPSAVALHDRTTTTEILSGVGIGDKSVALDSMQDLTITVRVETTNAGGALNAFAMLERIRIGLWRPSVYDALRAAEVAWIDELGRSLRQDYTVDNRRICSYTVDLRFRAILSDVPTGENIGTIEHVIVDGSLAGEPPTPATTHQTINRP